MSGPRLGAVSLLVPDYDRAITFFVAGLGFDLVEDRPMGDKRWVVVQPPGGGSALVLARPSDARQAALVGGQAGGRVWLFLHSDDFDRDHARLCAAGATFEDAPRSEAYGTVAVWRDPFGNRWDLIGPARDATSGPKSAGPGL